MLNLLCCPSDIVFFYPAVTRLPLQTSLTPDRSRSRSSAPPIQRIRHCSSSLSVSIMDPRFYRLPNMLFIMLKPGKTLPLNTATFRVPLSASKPLIANYLEQVYRVRVEMGGHGGVRGEGEEECVHRTGVQEE